MPASDMDANYLYIPIWLYSNNFKGDPLNLAEFFTFQSGYIQIAPGVKAGRGFTALHSNLVIFKYRCNKYGYWTLCLYIPIWLYSNKYPMTILSTTGTFTFQSGYIQIRLSFKSQWWDGVLYIPIWLYSNTGELITLSTPDHFTFQSGYIQIRPYHTTYLCRLKSTFLSTDK